MVEVAFAQADLNKDNLLDRGEFNNLVTSGVAGVGGNAYGGQAGLNSNYSASSYGADVGLAGNAASGYEGSSSYSAAGYGANYGAGGAAGYGAGGAAGYGAGGAAGYGAESAVGYGAGGAAGYGAGNAAGYGAGGAAGYESSSLALGGGAGYGAANESYGASSSNYSSQSSSQTSYATDSQGLFQDSNPQIIRRPAPGGQVTYTQNIRVRFLQPPPVPPPGPLIIKEVRPPQPPPPPPLRIRQNAPPLPQPPPLVLRERPPPLPQSVASQTVIRKLAAIAVPPRSVVIERLAAAPARPRDIIIERWVPYGAAAKRRTIVQRAGAAHTYQSPRNVIVQYEASQVRVVRQYQKLGVTPENPSAYVQRYGAQLLDSVTLVQQARAAGVFEDISPPVVPGSFAATEGQFSSTGGAAGAGGLTGQGVGGIVGELNYEATAGGVGSASNTEYAAFGRGGVLGIDSPAAASAHVGSAGEGATGFGAPQTLSAGYQTGESYATYGAGAAAGPGSGFTPGSLFNAADVNRDGVLTPGEFGAAGY